MIKKEDLTEEEVKNFLIENSAGKGFEEDGGWLLVTTKYVEADTGRRASWAHFPGTLEIFTKVTIQTIQRGEKIFLKSALSK